MTKVDDISIGDFVVVTKDLECQDVDYKGYMIIPREPIHYSGEPLEVIGIGLPFIVCKQLSRDSGRITIDTRRFAIQRVYEQYVSPFLIKDHIKEDGEIIKKKDNDHVRKICPECGNMLIESRFKDVFGIEPSQVNVYSAWAFKCSSCTFVGAKKKKV